MFLFCLEIEKLEKLRSLYLLWMQKSTANMSIKVTKYTVIYVILFRGGENYNSALVDVLLKHLFKPLCITENKFLHSTGGYPSSSEAGIKVTTLLCHTPFV